MKDRLITGKELAARIGIHPESATKFARTNGLKIVKLNPNSRKGVRFIESEVDSMIKRRIEAAKTTAAKKKDFKQAISHS